MGLLPNRNVPAADAATVTSQDVMESMVRNGFQPSVTAYTALMDACVKVSERRNPSFAPSDLVHLL